MKALIDTNILFANYSSGYSEPEYFIEYYIDNNDDYKLRIKSFNEYL